VGKELIRKEKSNERKQGNQKGKAYRRVESKDKGIETS